MTFFKDLSISSVAAGFVAVLVGITSSAVIVFQAARALGASPAEISSWILMLCLCMGVTSIGLSLYYRMPILTAWSTPGAAMLVTSVAGVSMAQAVGAFMVCAALIVVVGVTGWFDKAMRRIPGALAAAMLAGVLLRFGMEAFGSMQTQLVLVLGMFAVYLAARRWLPRYAVVLVLIAALVIVEAQGQLHLGELQLRLARPVFTAPTLSAAAFFSVALPLFLVTMASQNVPGVAMIRASGYSPPISPLMIWTGATAFALAPLGAYTVNLAAITAGICLSPDAHHDPKKRYTASVCAGFFYLIVGAFGASVAALLALFPKEMVLALAGLALLPTIANGLATSMRDETQREAAIVTFLVTASGLTLAGIGSAFWGLIAGAATMAVLHAGRKGLKRAKQAAGGEDVASGEPAGPNGHGSGEAGGTDALPGFGAVTTATEETGRPVDEWR
jgi:benzoate membrane transport protein